MPAPRRFDANGLHFTLVDFAGPTPGGQRIVAALTSWQGATWFFKLMRARPALVEGEKPAFIAFLQTVGEMSPE